MVAQSAKNPQIWSHSSILHLDHEIMVRFPGTPLIYLMLLLGIGYYKMKKRKSGHCQPKFKNVDLPIIYTGILATIKSTEQTGPSLTFRQCVSALSRRVSCDTRDVERLRDSQQGLERAQQQSASLQDLL